MPNSTEKDKKMLEFLNEEYSLPAVFRVKNAFYKTPSAHSGHSKVCHSDTEVKTLKAVNVDLCKELSKLQLENESYKDDKSEIKMLREKVYSLQKAWPQR